MIGKICPRGQDVAGLIRYLYGPGRREEHTDPHIIVGYRPPADLEPPLRANGSRDFRRLAGLLRLPHDALGKWGYAKPVWHCPMRAAPDDRLLSDAEWAGIARDVMHRTGLCPRGQEDDAVRWIAIRHGPDHIHLVAMLARQDRTRPRIVNERYRVRDACIAAERQYGLRSTAPADRTAARSPSRAETGKAARHGRGEPPRTTLRRHVAAAAASAASADEFFARLDQAGILVRLRYSTRNPGQVTGYAVALPGDTTRNGEPVWYGGGKLAADLSWPGLAQRWTRPARPDSPLRPDEADALWEYAARTAADATARIRFCTATGKPGRCRRRGQRRIRHAARRGRRARQPHPAPRRRRLRPRRPPALGAHTRPHPGREPAPPRRPADLRLRLPHRGPRAHPDHAAGPPRRPGRSRRRAARVPVARRPGRRRPPRRPPPPHRHQATCHPATRQARCTHHTSRTEITTVPPGHRRRTGPAQLPQPTPAPPSRIRPARTRPAPAATATSATAAAATGTHPLTSTKPYSCSARSGAAPGEIPVPHVPGSTRPGPGHPRGSHRSSSRWYRRYHHDPGVLPAVLRGLLSGSQKPGARRYPVF